jgi:hypothetical protein
MTTLPKQKFVIVKAPPSGALEGNDGKKSMVETKNQPLVLTGRPSMKARVGRRGSRRKGREPLVPNVPPSLDITLMTNVRIYYTNSSASATGVTGAELIAACGGICTVTNSTVVSFMSSFRIARVTIWPAVVSAGTATSAFADLTWSASSTSFTRDEEKIRPVPAGIANTGPVVFRPPAKALVSDWFTAAITNNLFVVAANVGSTLLLEGVATLSNSIAPASSTVAAGVLGSVYYLPLDGTSVHRWTPLGLTTTF